MENNVLSLTTGQFLGKLKQSPLISGVSLNPCGEHYSTEQRAAKSPIKQI